MPFVSVIVPTYRVGGIDILLDALARQTFGDFELVLVDMLYQHRADRVREYARDRFIRLVHIEPSPNNFPVASFCACVNAGLRAASGSVILHMVDFSAPAPDVLKRHAAFHQKHPDMRAGLMGPHRYVAIDAVEIPRYGATEWKAYQDDVESGALDDFLISIGHATARPDDGHIVDGGARASFDADPKLRMPPGPIPSDFFHLKNESYKWSQKQSLDEAFDGAHGYQDSDLSDRLDVTWMLDPTCVVDIANPRGILPMLRRDRDITENEKLLSRKRSSRKAPVAQSCVSATVNAAVPTLSIAMVYGEFSSAIHGPFVFSTLHQNALTGSESSFFNVATTLAERGHQVVVLAPAHAPHEHSSGVHMLPLSAIRGLPQMELDAVVAWNEPDYLQFSPPGAIRVVDQQLNDWGYCQYQNWRNLVDAFVFPSESSRQHHINDEGLVSASAGAAGHVIPNSVDLELFRYLGCERCGGIKDPKQLSQYAACPACGTTNGDGIERNPRRVVYCSSPDRGLHHLLSFWPDVRKAVPSAELKIFYRLEPWLARARDSADEIGRRARYIEEALRRLSGHGVEVVGPVPNREMARQLRMAAVLAYPCDPVRYTEGFGCSVLDACAAGCQPIVSNADALAEVHGLGGAMVIPGRPWENRNQWIRAIVDILERKSEDRERPAMERHATTHSRQEIGKRWEQLLFSLIEKRGIAHQ